MAPACHSSQCPRVGRQSLSLGNTENSIRIGRDLSAWIAQLISTLRAFWSVDLRNVCCLICMGHKRRTFLFFCFLAFERLKGRDLASSARNPAGLLRIKIREMARPIGMGEPLGRGTRTQVVRKIRVLGLWLLPVFLLILFV